MKKVLLVTSESLFTPFTADRGLWRGDIAPPAYFSQRGRVVLGDG